MFEDIFATSCQLDHDGLNPHRLHMEKDVSLAEVQALFGEEKGRNGFLIAEKLMPTLHKEVESLYYQCYRKPYGSSHVDKKLAMVWILEAKRVKINWARFVAKTNLG